PVIFLNFAHGTPKTEIWRGLHGASTLQAQCGKIVIALGEDIDASNADAVFWSLAYRTNLNEDLHVSPYRAPAHGPAMRRFSSTPRRSIRCRPLRCPRVSSWNAPKSYGMSWGCPSSTRSRP